MVKHANVEAVIKELQEKQVIIAYCCCGNRNTIKTSC